MFWPSCLALSSLVIVYVLAKLSCIKFFIVIVYGLAKLFCTK